MCSSDAIEESSPETGGKSITYFCKDAAGSNSK